MYTLTRIRGLGMIIIHLRSVIFAGSVWILLLCDGGIQGPCCTFTVSVLVDTIAGDVTAGRSVTH